MVWNPFRVRRERQERERMELEQLRSARRIMQEDITVFGEQLSDLETESAALDEDMQRDYQQALDNYERSKSEMREADELAEVIRIESVLTDGR